MVNIPKSERGTALLLALVTVIVVTMSMLLVASFIEGRKISFVTEERNVVISALADAAMAETLARMSESKNFKGIEMRSFGQGSISSTVSIESGGYRKVIAVGRFKLWAASIDAQVDVRGSRPIVVRWSYRQGPG